MQESRFSAIKHGALANSQKKDHRNDIMQQDLLHQIFSFAASPSDVILHFGLVHSSWHSAVENVAFLHRLLVREHVPNCYLLDMSQGKCSFNMVLSMTTDKQCDREFIMDLKRALCLWSLFSGRFCLDNCKQQGLKKYDGNRFFVKWRVWMSNGGGGGNQLQWRDDSSVVISASLTGDADEELSLKLLFTEPSLRKLVDSYRMISETKELYVNKETAILYFLNAVVGPSESNRNNLVLPKFIQIEGYATVNGDEPVIAVDVMSFDFVELLPEAKHQRDFVLNDIHRTSKFIFDQKLCGTMVTNMRTKSRVILKEKRSSSVLSQSLSVIESTHYGDRFNLRYPLIQQSIWKTRITPPMLLCTRDSLLYSGILLSRDTILLKELRIKKPAFDWRLFTEMPAYERLKLIGNASAFGSIMTGFATVYVVPYLFTHTLQEMHENLQKNLLRVIIKTQMVNLIYIATTYGPGYLIEKYISKKLPDAGLIVRPLVKVQELAMFACFFVWVSAILGKNDENTDQRNLFHRLVKPWLAEWLEYYLKSSLFIFGVDCGVRLLPYSLSFSLSVGKHIARRCYMLFRRVNLMVTRNR